MLRELARRVTGTDDVGGPRILAGWFFGPPAWGLLRRAAGVRRPPSRMPGTRAWWAGTRDADGVQSPFESAIKAARDEQGAFCVRPSLFCQRRDQRTDAIPAHNGDVTKV
jgi:hypothetical protein